MQRVTDILDFWFGDRDSLTERYPQRVQQWFAKDEAFDQAIRTQFSRDIDEVANGHRQEWLTTPPGYLASILCLDQFTRNCFRGDSKSYAYDKMAQALTTQGLSRQLDEALHPIERMFFYLPLEHAEDLACQKKMLACCDKLYVDATAELRPHIENFKEFAQKHYDIIARFGRFPHRNHILNRASTAEEIDFLKQPGSAF